MGLPHCTEVYKAIDRRVRDGLIERQAKVIRVRAAGPDVVSGRNADLDC